MELQLEHRSTGIWRNQCKTEWFIHAL